MFVRLALIASAFPLLVAGCDVFKKAAPAADVHVDWTILPTPPTVGPIKATLALKDPSGAPIRGATIEIEGNMTHPGMAPENAKAVEGPDGSYRFDMNLTMAGDWVLSAAIRLTDGRTSERRIDLRGVR